MIFSQIIGQKQGLELLTRAIETNRIAPAYLFSGPAGIGKYLAALEFTTFILAREQNLSLVRHRVHQQNHPDLLRVEPTFLHQGKLLTQGEADAEGLKRKAPPQIRVEQVREVTQFLSRPPLEAPRSVVIINEAQMMAEAAGNALLKTLEEPGQATIILIAPSPDTLLTTLVSRCQRIPFSRLSFEELKQVLAQTGYSEIIEQEIICSIAQGSPGEAITACEQLKNVSSDLLKQLENLINHQETSELKNIEIAFSMAQKIAANFDFSAQIWLVNYLQQLYWEKKFCHGVTTEILSALEQLEQSRKLLLKYVQPRLVWEVTLLKLMTSDPIHS